MGKSGGTAIGEDELEAVAAGTGGVQESERLYRRMLDDIQHGITLIDRAFRIVTANAALERMLGAAPGGLAGRCCFEAFERRDRPCSHCPGIEVMGSGRPALEHRHLMRTAEGSFWVQACIFPHYDAHGEPAGFVKLVADVSSRVEAEARQRRTASVFDNTHDGIIITDRDGSILEVNRAFTRLTGYAAEEAVGRNARMLQSGLHDRSFYEAMWRAIVEEGSWEGEINNRRKDGSIYLESLAIHVVRDEAGGVQHYVGVFSDITEMRATQKRLESLAHYDPLTGLPNRVLFADRMHQALAHATRRGGLIGVGYLDLDVFKPINDTHGHHVGDGLLVEVAQRLAACVRVGDTVARLGGDEFALLLIDLESAEEVDVVLSRLLEAVAAPVRVGGLSLKVSASVGITLHPLDDSDPDTLLRHADQAMYAAKQSGRATYVIFDAEQDRLARDHREMVSGVRRALERDEFLLHYQPKIDMRRGEVVGVEALIRWRHPALGLLTPAHFLSAIEDSDLSVQVDRWVLREVIRQMSEWADKGLTLPVSVNISARLLHQPRLDEWLRERFAEHPNVPPSWLELEILETAALQDIERVSRVIEACGRLGVSSALDDFGTGYSSLTYLKRLPTASLKIDRSFVANMLDDMEDLAIVEGVLGLAAAFDRKVVAEGVEAAGQGNVLMQFGCNVAQGYGLAVPMPPERLEAWLPDFQLGSEWSPSTLPLQREDLPLLSAELAHRRWIDQVLAAADHGSGTAVTLDAHACGFGRWYERRGREKYGVLDEYAGIQPIYLKMHETARRLLGAAATGDAERTELERAVLLELHERLMAALDDLRVAMTLHTREAAV